MTDYASCPACEISRSLPDASRRLECVLCGGRDGAVPHEVAAAFRLGTTDSYSIEDGVRTVLESKLVRSVTRREALDQFLDQVRVLSVLTLNGVDLVTDLIKLRMGGRGL